MRFTHQIDSQPMIFFELYLEDSKCGYFNTHQLIIHQYIATPRRSPRRRDQCWQHRPRTRRCQHRSRFPRSQDPAWKRNSSKLPYIVEIMFPFRVVKLIAVDDRAGLDIPYLHLQLLRWRIHRSTRFDEAGRVRLAIKSSDKSRGRW